MILAKACEEAARDPAARHYFEARDFAVMGVTLRSAAARAEKTHERLRRAIGALRDVERAGVATVIVEIDAEMTHAG